MGWFAERGERKERKTGRVKGSFVAARLPLVLFKTCGSEIFKGYVLRDVFSLSRVSGVHPGVSSVFPGVHFVVL